MANGDVYERAAQAAETPSTPTEQLLGEVFSIESFRKQTTKFGERYIATIRWPVDSDATQEAWMSGVKLSRQLEAIKDDLPVVFKLGGKGNQESPYELVEPGAESAPSLPVAPAKKTVRQKLEDPLAHFRTLPGGSLDFDKFVRTLEQQAEGFTRYELTAVIGAYSVQALEHWLKVKNGTITDLKNAILARREVTPEGPPEEEIPFE